MSSFALQKMGPGKHVTVVQGDGPHYQNHPEGGTGIGDDRVFAVKTKVAFGNEAVYNERASVSCSSSVTGSSSSSGDIGASIGGVTFQGLAYYVTITLLENELVGNIDHAELLAKLAKAEEKDERKKALDRIGSKR